MSVAMLDLDWRALSVCRGATDEEMFPLDRAGITGIQIYCRHCPVIQQCLADALEMDTREGIRGGMSEEQRLPLHLARAEAALSIPKSAPVRRAYRVLTTDAELELRDMADERGKKARREYRLKLGELYESGISTEQLIAAGVSNDRIIWRGIYEYRSLMGIQNRHHTPTGKKANQKRKDERLLRPASSLAYRNFHHLAQTAPTPEARAYWQRKAEGLSY